MTIPGSGPGDHRVAVKRGVPNTGEAIIGEAIGGSLGNTQLLWGPTFRSGRKMESDDASIEKDTKRLAFAKCMHCCCKCPCNGHLWPSMVMYGHLWPCMATHGPRWARMAMHRHVLHCVAMCGHVWPCMAMHGHVFPCMAMYSHVRQYMAM